MLLRAALAGGIASGGTTLALFPLDTLKTRVQSFAGATIAEVARSAPRIGLRGLYRWVPLWYPRGPWWAVLDPLSGYPCGNPPGPCWAVLDYTNHNTFIRRPGCIYFYNRNF